MNNEFSSVSKRRLSSCDKGLQDVFYEVIKYVDITILEGYRSPKRQEQMYMKGLSKLRGGQSKHNKMRLGEDNLPTLCSCAVDAALYHKDSELKVDWENREEFILLAGFILGVAQKLDVPLRWGGDWDRDFNPKNEHFSDLCHFELVNIPDYII